MTWNPAKHSIVIDDNMRGELYNIGYLIGGNIGEEKIDRLIQLYKSKHSLNSTEGGMFYSLYSKDLEYRKIIHDEINTILLPFYNRFFSDFKSVINSFIVKTPGPHSDFTLHQDSTGLDENKFSPLSIWIPLQDTDIKNGALCVVPKTHHFFHPYRGISFPSPFTEYEATVRKYLVPISLKAGDMLMFDNRLVHYSHINYSASERIVVMSGLFPTSADILSVYKDMDMPNSPIEIYKQKDDFLLTNTAFFENCTARPYQGTVIQKIYEQLEGKTVYDFLSWAKQSNVSQTNIDCLLENKTNMKIISEPKYYSS
jgi:hypothetical protein